MYTHCLFSRDAWNALTAICHRADKLRNETGFLLLGPRTVMEVDGLVALGLAALAVIGPGPSAQATSVSYAADTAYQQRELNSLLRAHPTWTLLGEGHLHPRWLSTPSSHDLRMAAAMAADPDYGFADGVAPIFIATMRGGHLSIRGFSVTGTERRPLAAEFDIAVVPPPSTILLLTVEVAP